MMVNAHRDTLLKKSKRALPFKIAQQRARVRKSHAALNAHAKA
jgi:hypothetical protein